MTTVNPIINAPKNPQTSSRTNGICVCDTQPLTAIGVRAMLGDHETMRVDESVDLLSAAFDFLRENPTGVLLIDKAFGVSAICESIEELREQSTQCSSIVVWGALVSPAEAMRFLRAGARGIVRKTAEVTALVACLEAVTRGRVWVEDCMLQDSRPHHHRDHGLSQREEEVLELVQEGLSNKDIALRLSIQPGTVKIHVKHIFEKTGIHGRHSLALARFSELQAAAAACDPELLEVNIHAGSHRSSPDLMRKLQSTRTRDQSRGPLAQLGMHSDSSAPV